MPITRSAKKTLRSSKKKALVNDRRKRAMKRIEKDVRKLVIAKDTDAAAAKISEAYQAIDKAMKRGVIKKNTAARKKSRLTKAIKHAK